jgi:hypothetical protein
MVAVCEKPEEHVQVSLVRCQPGAGRHAGHALNPPGPVNRSLLAIASTAIDAALSENSAEFLRLHRQLEGE